VVIGNASGTDTLWFLTPSITVLEGSMGLGFFTGAGFWECKTENSQQTPNSPSKILFFPRFGTGEWAAQIFDLRTNQGLKFFICSRFYYL
jgi:hypothetical protein